MGHQQRTYKERQEIMKNNDIYNKWSELIEKYSKHFKTNEEEWSDTFAALEKFIQEKGKRPSTVSKNNDEKVLAGWVGSQQYKYRTMQYVMKNPEIYDKWTEFMDKNIIYFKTNEDVWYDMLTSLGNFMNDNAKRPSLKSKNPSEKMLGNWVIDQLSNYKNKQNIMKSNDEIYNKWGEFTKEYIEYFMTNEETWYNMLAKAEQFILDNQKRPSTISKNSDEKILGNWIGSQLQKYRNKQEIMKNEDIYNKWEHFVNKYATYFRTNEDLWVETLGQLRKFIQDNARRPSQHTKNKDEKKLASWIGTQQKNYKAKQCVMENDEIYKKWEEFVDNSEQYFKTNDDEWEEMFAKTEEFIITNRKRPSSESKCMDEKKMGSWILNQQNNYNKNQQRMKNEEMREKWLVFINKYVEFFEHRKKYGI